MQKDDVFGVPTRRDVGNASNSVRYDPANYRGVYTSLAKSTNVFSTNAAKAADIFFKGESPGIIKQKRSRKTESGGKHEMTAFRRKKPSIEEIERRLREAKVVVKAEPILAGTGYWGRAEAEFANAIGDEKDPKRKGKMAKRRKELAEQLKDLSREEREQILLEEINKWKKKAQKNLFSGPSEQ